MRNAALGCALAALGACAAAGDSAGTGRNSGREGSGASGKGGSSAGTGGGAAGMDFGNNEAGMGPEAPHVPVNTVIEMGKECAATGATAKNEIRPVDIIWAIDSSPSMTLVIDAMAMQMNTLVSTVTAAGISVHIIFISAEQREDPIFNLPTGPVICIMPPVGSGNCANDSNPPTYLHVMGDCCWVGSHNALNRIIDTYAMYMSALQPGSIKYFGAVTDDTAGDTLDFKSQADKFIADAAGIGAGMPGVDWKFFGIINPSTGGAYQMLADQTMGMTGMIGAGQDYSALFNMLAQTVTTTSQLSCEWAIPEIPEAAGMFNKFKVNVTYTPGSGGAPMQFGKLEEAQCAAAPEGGWFYDSEDAPTKVVVCPQTCDTLKADLMGKVDVLFGCDTVKAPL
jgi:hypothetical protein